MFDLGHARNKCIFCVRLFPDTKSEDASVYAGLKESSDQISNQNNSTSFTKSVITIMLYYTKGH